MNKEKLKADILIKTFVDDINFINEAGKKDRLSDNKIILIQETYLKAVVLGLFKSLRIDKDISFRLIEEIKNKIK